MAEHEFSTNRQVAKTLGKKRYQGEPCRYAHSGERFVSNRGCVECAARRASANKAYNTAYAREWRERNLGKAAAACARHNAANREKRRAQSRVTHALNPERGRAKAAMWRALNPAGMRAHAMARHARKRGAVGSYTANDIEALFVAQASKCANCRKSLKSAYHVDHKQPLSKGGRNDRTNIELLCPTCNMRKHASDPFEWAQRNGRLL